VFIALVISVDRSITGLNDTNENPDKSNWITDEIKYGVAAVRSTRAPGASSEAGQDKYDNTNRKDRTDD
jgi:hypothetical protein